MGWLSSLFRIVAEVFGFVRKNQELRNTPEMLEAAKNRDDARIKDETREAVSKKDTQKIRELLS